jgi:PAS domain S-box-containing protein
MEMKSETIKVLLIEDDEDDYILTRELLSEVKGGKYAVDWAPSYEEGLKVAGRREHHVCLVDYRLGERSGVQLIREAREFGLTTPMILLTGQGNHDVDVEAIEAGATDYLVKDETSIARLERTIRYAVELNTERCRAEEKLAEIKRAQEELRTSEIRYRRLFEAARDGILILNGVTLKITDVNPFMTELLGYSPDEFLGKELWEIGLFSDKGVSQNAFRELQAKRYLRYEDLPLQTSQGMLREVEFVSNAYEEDGHQVIQCNIRDITERKLIEVELKRARDVALESVRLKSEFLANMSHEIRTPMNAIIGMTELVMETVIDDQQRGYIDTIASSAESLLIIINDILDLSKIEAGMLTFETIDFDLRFTVESVLELVAERVRAKELEMALLFDRDVPTRLCGDPTRLHQILTNLVANAVKFTESGKVAVRVSKQSEKDERVTIRIDVTDTGIGISENDQKALFTPFVQADGSVTRRYGGTGLGLAIAKQLVEMMGGTIGVISEPGSGSTFSFTASFIKRASQEPTGEHEGQPANVTLKEVRIPRDHRSVVMSAKTAGGRGTRTLVTQHSLKEMKTFHDRSILLVEDNEVNQTVARDQLATLGHRVDVVSNGQEALDALSLRSYNVVLMDCGMPVMDGYTATAEIRKREGDARHTPIVAMTAHAMNGDREKCLAAGMDAYIAKPVKRKTLEGIFATLFGNGNLSAAQDVPSVPTATATADDSSIVDLVCLKDAGSTPGKVKHIIELYLRHTGERLEELNTALKQQSANDVYAIAHKCLGSSRTCGMTAIVPALAELQRMGKARDLNGAADQFNAAQAAFQKLKPFLELYLEQIPA